MADAGIGAADAEMLATGTFEKWFPSATDDDRAMIWGLAANAAARPAHTALVCGDRRLSYGELDALVNRVANALAARGVGAGDRVAMLLGNRPEFLAVTHAAGKLGALAVPINHRWRRDEIAYLLADAAPDVLVVDGAFLGEVEPARAAAGRPRAGRACLVVGGGSAELRVVRRGRGGAAGHAAGERRAAGRVQRP